MFIRTLILVYLISEKLFVNFLTVVERFLKLLDIVDRWYYQDYSRLEYVAASLVMIRGMLS